MSEPDGPAWNSTGQEWTHSPNGPPDSLCQSQWAWMGGQAKRRAAVDDPQLLYDHLQSQSEHQRLEAAYALASQGADGVPTSLGHSAQKPPTSRAQPGARAHQPQPARRAICAQRSRRTGLGALRKPTGGY